MEFDIGEGVNLSSELPLIPQRLSSQFDDLGVNNESCVCFLVTDVPVLDRIAMDSNGLMASKLSICSVCVSKSSRICLAVVTF